MQILSLPLLRSARRERIPLCRRTEGAAGAGNSVSDAAWAGYLWFNANPKGEAREIWLYLTCMAMFAMRRDTAANTVMGSDALEGLAT